jgi:phosphoserine phosphatase
MFIATLLTNPTDPKLDRQTVESLRNAWGGGDAVWLNPAIAAEFPLEAMPENRWEAWEGLQALGVDLVVQPAENRRKKLLLADMDSTMIQQECIDELADEAGVGAHVAGITARAMNGELDFEEALRERVSLLRGLPESVIARVIENRITLMPGGQALVSTMKSNGARAALVSVALQPSPPASRKRLDLTKTAPISSSWKTACSRVRSQNRSWAARQRSRR